ncbi:MAG: peptidoglycan-associated lipoprotein Pal [Solirubrobacterales bacterium]
MRNTVLTAAALAAMLAVSACSSSSTDTGAASGTGNALGRQSTLPPSQTLTDAERLAQMQRELSTTVGDRVFFDTDSFSLNGEGRGVLDRQVAFLRRYPTVQLQIQGHADERGTREYNLALGDRRANSVKEYLVANGIPASRLVTVSFGKERPEAVGANASSWAKNRRAVSVIAK